jgi:flagellar protein FlgJ
MAARRDPRQFAREINRDGYATDPTYAAKLIGLMDRYNLYRYDDV